MFGKAHLFGDDVGEGADPFGVATGAAIVAVEGFDEVQRFDGSDLGVEGETLALEVGDDLLGIFRVAELESELDAVWCGLGELEVHVAERREGEETVGEVADEAGDHRGEDEHGDTPADADGERPAGLREEVAEGEGDGEGNDERDKCNAETDETSKPRPRPPGTLVGFLNCFGGSECHTRVSALTVSISPSEVRFSPGMLRLR